MITGDIAGASRPRRFAWLQPVAPIALAATSLGAQEQLWNRLAVRVVYLHRTGPRQDVAGRLSVQRPR